MKPYRPVLESLEERSTPTIIAPSNLEAIVDSSAPVKGSLVTIVWNDNSDNEAHFIVEQIANNGNVKLIGVSINPTFTFTINGHKTYYYRVYAVGVDGNSDYTNTVAVHNIPGAKNG